MSLFSRSKDQYECPVCARRATDESKYCSACYMHDRDANAGSKVLRVVVKRSKNNTRNPILLIAALLLGLLLITAAYLIWNQFYDEPTATSQPVNRNEITSPKNIEPENDKNQDEYDTKTTEDESVPTPTKT